MEIDLHRFLKIILLFISFSGAAQSSLFQSWGLAEGAATAGTAAVFVVAYAVHKAMAPWRIGLTLTVVPFAVKKLRAKGYLKTSKPKATAN